MNNEDIISVVQELPLHVSLSLKRVKLESLLSPLTVNENSNKKSLNQGHCSPNIASIKVGILGIEILIF